MEDKGYIKGTQVKEGKMPEKTVYELTESGSLEFEKLMLEISAKPIHFFLDFNAVIVNLYSLPPTEQKKCLLQIEQNINSLKEHLQENIDKKEALPEIPEAGMAVLKQQFLLTQAVETWIASLKESIPQ